MAIYDDVVVVGGGLAGWAAALAARDAGASVRLVSDGQSTLRHASGLVDVLGYSPSGDGPLVDPFEELASLPDEHPYAIVGESAIRAGLALFDDAVAGYEGSHTDRNALVPTFGGSVKPTARYPASATAGLASDPRDALLVGFETIADFDAPLVAAHLSAAGVPFAVGGATVPFPGHRRVDATVTRYAHALDRDEPAEGESKGVGTREALAERVADHLDGEARVGFPAILGRDHPEEVRANLAARLDADVFEVPMGPPSLPGLRLADQLSDSLADAGVRVSAGNSVVDYAADGDRVEAVVVDREGSRVPYHADAFVLATGGLVGKGIDSDREGVCEPLFDCHVAHPEDRYDWSGEGPFDAHPFARFGVRVDPEGRPLDASGRPEFANLRAAGSVLGGFDFAAEKSASGVSLATGWVAGTNAGERT